MFGNITLVEVVPDMTTRPDEQKELFNVYFRLSASPDNVWADIFEKVHKNHLHSMLRKAYVEGEYIVVYCGLDEVQKYHVGILKQDLKETNRHYREYLEEEEQRIQRENQAVEETEKQIKEKLSNIKI